MKSPKYILFAIPFFLLMILIELIIDYRKRGKFYRFNDAITNLNIGIGNQAIGLFVTALILTFYDWIYTEFAFFHLPVTWWSFLLCLLLFDFIFYWAHRWGHTVNFFWGAHVVHHSSEEYNLSVALRQPWFHNLIAFILFFPMPLLGFHPLMFGTVGAIHTIYQFWIHTKAIGKLPKPIEWIFNTPSHHRVHHGVNRKYIDRNHGGLLIIWDRLFGTFQEEEEEVAYGITKPLNSWNPAWANVHYYVDLIRDMKQVKGFYNKLKLLFAKPGWMPEEAGGFRQIPEITPERKKYDTPVSMSMKLYVFVQFVLLTLGLCAYMYYFNTMSLFYQLLFLSIIILSGMICGGIMENKKWVIYAEYVRLLLAAISLPVFYYYRFADWFAVMLVGAIAGFIIFNLWFTVEWLVRRKSLTPSTTRH